MSTPAPLTLTNLNEAMSTCREELLRPYIDRAIGIYCNLSGKSVGPRPARFCDGSRKYRDAYYLSYNAVYEVWTRIGAKYDPSRDFENYFVKSVRNELLDILGIGGRTDWLSRPAKERSKDDAFDNLTKVDADGYWGDSGSEPDTTESDREGKISVFMSDALDALIKYLDGLSEKKRTILLESDFGSDLFSSDQDKSGKDYADALAEQYHTKAGNIRKMASVEKRKALEAVRNQGFNKRAFTAFECLQAAPSYVRVYDEVIEATEQLTPFEQFFLLTHIEDMKCAKGV